jgi:hypothetical protein
MFKVKYDDMKRRCKRKVKQRRKEKTQCSNSGKLFNGAHREAKALVEIHNFDFFILFFFQFCITKIGSTPSFSSIGQKVWPIEILEFSTQNLKHHPGSELGTLEVEFEPLAVGKPK